MKSLLSPEQNKLKEIWDTNKIKKNKKHPKNRHSFTY